MCCHPSLPKFLFVAYVIPEIRENCQSNKGIQPRVRTPDLKNNKEVFCAPPGPVFRVLTGKGKEERDFTAKGGRERRGREAERRRNTKSEGKLMGDILKERQNPSLFFAPLQGGFSSLLTFVTLYCIPLRYGVGFPVCRCRTHETGSPSSPVPVPVPSIRLPLITPV